MVCSVPQGSCIGPFLWNVIHDGLLIIGTLKNMSLIRFANDTIIVCHIDLFRVNDALAHVKRWLEGRHLQMALKKQIQC